MVQQCAEILTDDTGHTCVDTSQRHALTREFCPRFICLAIAERSGEGLQVKVERTREPGLPSGVSCRFSLFLRVASLLRKICTPCYRRGDEWDILQVNEN